jgi:hypothetical protein
MPERATKPGAPGKNFHEIESYSNDDTPLRAYVIGCLKYDTSQSRPCFSLLPPSVLHIHDDLIYFRRPADECFRMLPRKTSQQSLGSRSKRTPIKWHERAISPSPRPA